MLLGTEGLFVSETLFAFHHHRPVFQLTAEEFRRRYACPKARVLVADMSCHTAQELRDLDRNTRPEPRDGC